MNTIPIAFVAFEQFDNLGIGYLAAVLSGNGYKSTLVDFRLGKEKILEAIRGLKPLIVGFSVIFQYHIYEFEDLIRYLRTGGVLCHFTAGGQYASLRYEDLFETIPSLDSVVRFEGEYTFLDLVNHIYAGTDWKKIDGIAFKWNSKIKVNPLRPVEEDLDKFPIPFRSPLKEYALDRKFATLLASRGCVNNCSFCYLREYYRQSSGPYKRVRKPGNVVLEIESLHQKMDCSVFLFQDDDFPVKSVGGSEWIRSFCNELELKNLSRKIIWKINCRPDEVDVEKFSLMKEHGLYLVFLGIEDGTDNGLNILNKHMTAAKCLSGIDILKRLGIGFDYGFMLFQPSSTFITVNNNLDFLRDLCGDGYSPVNFLKLMPYCSTPVEDQLRNEGRLKGMPGFYDYDFFEESMNHYYSFIKDCLINWLSDSDGLSNISKWARNYISVFSHYFDLTTEVSLISQEIKNTISESNLYLLDQMKELLNLFESGKYDVDHSVKLKHFRKDIELKHDHFKDQINNSMVRLLRIVEHQRNLKLTLKMFNY